MAKLYDFRPIDQDGNPRPSRQQEAKGREYAQELAKAGQHTLTLTQWEIPTPTNTSYEGWTNRATWCVSLWLNSDSPDYIYELANRKHNAPHILADMLREQVSTWWYDMVEMHQLSEASMWHDLMTATLSQVNLLEIIDDHREIEDA